MLDERKAQLLAHIVEEYLSTAEPVASGQLVRNYELAVSPATVRSDMAALEHEGYILSPHTSAGRIPTEQGYRYYVQMIAPHTQKAPIATEKKQLTQALELDTDARGKLKNAARMLSEIADGAVIVGFSQNDVYYTGISHLFSQPEFYHPQIMSSMGAVVDQFESRITEVFQDTPEAVTVRIGSENPFSEVCTFIGFTFPVNSSPHPFGLMGPMRMSYQKNIKRLEFIRQLLIN